MEKINGQVGSLKLPATEPVMSLQLVRCVCVCVCASSAETAQSGHLARLGAA